ncbi:hypothetical protein BJ508DRAFT_327376 [Ascobolus immersus RN42]|uniref:Uncharacterized protein n=1 Tax=Ascobolus immersus RN42 TaxID=1160509 RepID=A0A3N4I2Y3_ASCIM|nr:hypothetical protein BJ508DRAFT_327376 [Ascobolus immersus RN42]
MDHPDAPKTITLQNGRLGCSHPKCADLAFRSETGIGVHYATIHTVPYGDGLTAKAIEARIVDWDPISQKKLNEALEAAKSRVEQIEIIAQAGKNCESSVNRTSPRLPTPPKGQQQWNQQWNSRDNRNNKNISNNKFRQDLSWRSAAAIPVPTEKPKTRFNPKALPFNPTAPSFEPKANNILEILLASAGSAAPAITKSDAQRGQAIPNSPIFENSFEAGRNDFIHKYENPPTPPLSPAAATASVVISRSTPLVIEEAKDIGIEAKAYIPATEELTTGPVLPATIVPRSVSVSDVAALVTTTSDKAVTVETSAATKDAPADLVSSDNIPAAVKGTLLGNGPINVSTLERTGSSSPVILSAMQRFKNGFNGYRSSYTRSHIMAAVHASSVLSDDSLQSKNKYKEPHAEFQSAIGPAPEHKPAHGRTPTAPTVARSPSPNLVVGTPDWGELPLGPKQAVSLKSQGNSNRAERSAASPVQPRSTSPNIVRTPELHSNAEINFTPTTPHKGEVASEVKRINLLEPANTPIRVTTSTSASTSASSSPITLVTYSTNGRDDDEITVVNEDEHSDEERLAMVAEAHKFSTNLERLSVKYDRPIPAFPLRLIRDILAGKYNVEFINKTGVNFDIASLPHGSFLTVVVRTGSTQEKSPASHHTPRRTPSSPQEVMVEKIHSLFSSSPSRAKDPVGSPTTFQKYPIAKRISSSTHTQQKAESVTNPGKFPKKRKPLTEAQLENRHPKNRERNMEAHTSSFQTHSEQIFSHQRQSRPSSRLYRSNPDNNLQRGSINTGTQATIGGIAV